MNKIFSCVVCLIIGAAGGFFAGRNVSKKQCDKTIREEVESVKKSFKEMYEKKVQKPNPEKKKEMVENVKKAMNAYRGVKIDIPKTPEKEIIPPENSDEPESYQHISFTYWADGVITDDDDNPLTPEQVENSIGQESLTHFGEYEDDSVVVRNNKRKVIYEILSNAMSFEKAKNDGLI